MALSLRDRVQDSTTTTGTGNLTLVNTPPPKHRTVNSVYATNDVFYYVATHRTAAEWETGLGRYLGSHVIQRVTVHDGSSGVGVPVNFSAGVKDVAVAQVGRLLDRPYGLVHAHRNDVDGGTGTAGAWNLVQFTTETYDPDNVFNIATRRYQPTEPGLYLFILKVSILSATTATWAALYKNGVFGARGSFDVTPGTAVGTHSLCVAIFSLNGSTDYVEPFHYIPAGATGGMNGNTYDTYFQGYRLSLGTP